MSLESFERSIQDLQSRVQHLERDFERLGGRLEADLDQLSVSLREDIVALRRDVEGVRAHLSEFYADRWPKMEASLARIAAVEKQLERVVFRLDTSAEGQTKVLQAIAEIAPDVASQAPIWESENGRRVLWWAACALVLSSLAVGGGLTAEQGLRWITGAPPAAQPPPNSVPTP